MNAPRAETSRGLVVRGLAAGYGAERVLEGIDFDLERGELVALVGPNGSGKSTLLRALSGTLRQVEGEVLLDKEKLLELSARERARRVAVVPQRPTSPPGFRVRELVLLGRAPWLSPWRTASAQDCAAADRALTLAGLEGFEDHEAARLSGGEQQRVAIARALAQEPRLLLLDEATASLDWRHSGELEDLVRRLARTSELSVLFAAHDLNLAARLGSRVLLLHQGRVHLEGTAGEVLRPEILTRVYGRAVEAVPHPVTGRPILLPPSGPAAE